MKYRRPVFLGEKMVATATWARTKTNKHLVKVVTRVNDEEVFEGKFVIVSLSKENQGEGEV